MSGTELQNSLMDNLNLLMLPLFHPLLSSDQGRRTMGDLEPSTETPESLWWPLPAQTVEVSCWTKHSQTKLEEPNWTQLPTNRSSDQSQGYPGGLGEEG